MSWQVLCGDCVAVMADMEEASVDAVVCDPPYGLGAQPDMAEVLRHWLAGDDYASRGGGFMGEAWDSFVPGPATWREVFQVLKPGGHLISFFGTRTYDLGVVAIRLAGFEVRDQLAYMFGTGFPKSHNLDGDRQGWGTALKPAHEPIVMARKPLTGTVAANVLAHGTGALNVDGCRIGNGEGVVTFDRADGERNREEYRTGTVVGGAKPAGAGRWPANVLLDEQAAAQLDAMTSGFVGRRHDAWLS